MAHDVFISYATSDKAVADAVCSQLESIHRIRCWIAPRDVTPGASWAESIIDALDGSKIMVLIFSSNANASMQIEREVERAVHKGIHIIPLRIENTIPTKTLEYFISAPHWLDALSVPLELHITKLAAGVKALLSKHGTQEGKPAATMAAAAHVTPVPVPVAKDRAAARRSWVVPVAVAAVLAVAVAALAMRWKQGQAPESATAAETAAAPTTPVQPVAPAATPSTTAPLPTPSPVRTPVTPEAPAAIAEAPVAVRNPNLFIDFRNTLEEGTVTLEVDGQKRWSEKLGSGLKGGAMSAVKIGRRFEDLGASLNLSKGVHKVTVSLLTPAGKVRETRTTSLPVDPAIPRTLRIRLSRFKNNLEFATVVGKPATAGDAPATAQKPATPVKAKPLASTSATPAK